jgi:hypothetical protein
MVGTEEEADVDFTQITRPEKREGNPMAGKRILTFALLLGFMMMTAAHATTLFTTLYTPPLFPDGDSQIDCYLVNVSEQTRDATISVPNRDARS